jgi:hypothetical protein
MIDEKVVDALYGILRLYTDDPIEQLVFIDELKDLLEKKKKRDWSDDLGARRAATVSACRVLMEFVSHDLGEQGKTVDELALRMGLRGDGR